MSIKVLLGLVAFLVLIAALAVVFEPYLRTGTPYQEGSGEWVGYTAAEANGFTRAEECTSDPETRGDAEFVEGCKRFVKMAS